MPRTSSKKNNHKKSWATSFRSKISQVPKVLLFAGAIVCIAGVYFGYIQTRNYFEKRDLLEKQAKLKKTAGEIIESSQNHTSRQDFFSCINNSGFKFEERTYLCESKIVINYNKMSVSEIDNELKSIAIKFGLELKTGTVVKDIYAQLNFISPGCAVYFVPDELTASSLTVTLSCVSKTNSEVKL